MSSKLPLNISKNIRTIRYDPAPVHSLDAFSPSRTPPLDGRAESREGSAAEYPSDTMGFTKKALYRSALAQLQQELGMPDDTTERLDATIKELILPHVVSDAAYSGLNYGLNIEAIASYIHQRPAFRPYFQRACSRNIETCFHNAIYYWTYVVRGSLKTHREQRGAIRRSSDSQIPPSSGDPKSALPSESSATPEFSAAPEALAHDEIFVALHGSASQLAGDLWMRLYPGEIEDCLEIRAISGIQEEVVSGRMEDLLQASILPRHMRYGYHHIVPYCRKFLEKSGGALESQEIQLFYFVKMPNLASPIRVSICDNLTWRQAYKIWLSLGNRKVPFMLFLDDTKVDPVDFDTSSASSRTTSSVSSPESSFRTLIPTSGRSLRLSNLLSKPVALYE